MSQINEGILIIDEKSEIIFCNIGLECIINSDRKELVGENIFLAFPSLDKNYIKTAFNEVLQRGNVMFFSAAIHKEILPSKESLNFRISILESDSQKKLLLEFIPITSKVKQINQLTDYVNRLYEANIALQEKEAIIKNIAYYDNLTGIANRTLFYKIADKYLQMAEVEQRNIGLLFIDVDGFKQFNDTYGHEIGDKILVKVAETLSKQTRQEDIVARYGGDEFLILLTNDSDVKNYKEIIERIVNLNDNKVMIENNEIKISLSVGISFYPMDGDNIDKIITRADENMYVMKRRRKFEPDSCNK